MTESEKARVREIEAALSPMMTSVSDHIAGEMGMEADDDIRALMFGVPLAAVDAWFAIRDGEEWRGMTDPKEIAKRMLRDMGMSDEAHQNDG